MTICTAFSREGRATRSPCRIVRVSGGSQLPDAPSRSLGNGGRAPKMREPGPGGGDPALTRTLCGSSVPYQRRPEVVEHLVDRVGDGDRRAASEEQAEGAWVGGHVLDEQRARVARGQEAAAP